MDLNKLSLGDRIVAGLGIVEILLLFIVPWHSVEVFGQTFTIKPLEGDSTAVAWPAAIALILLLAIVAVIAIRKLAPTVTLPQLPIPWNTAIFYATIAVPVLLLLKLVLETDSLSFWAYILIAIGVGIAYGGYLISQEADEAVGRGSTPPTPF